LKFVVLKHYYYYGLPSAETLNMYVVVSVLLIFVSCSKYWSWLWNCWRYRRYFRLNSHLEMESRHTETLVISMAQVMLLHLMEGGLQ